MPQVRGLNLGLGVDVSFLGVCDASGIEAMLRRRTSAFYYVQLLPAATAIEVEDRARDFCGRVGEGARRDGVSVPGLLLRREMDFHTANVEAGFGCVKQTYTVVSDSQN